MKYLLTISLILLSLVLQSTQAFKPGGGWRTINLKQLDEGAATNLQRIANFALTEINKQSNSIHPFTLVRVTYARTQVVAGLNYDLTLELDLDGRHELHEVVVWDKFGTLQLTSHNLADQQPTGGDDDDDNTTTNSNTTTTTTPSVVAASAAVASASASAAVASASAVDTPVAAKTPEVAIDVDTPAPTSTPVAVPVAAPEKPLLNDEVKLVAALGASLDPPQGMPSRDVNSDGVVKAATFAVDQLNSTGGVKYTLNKVLEAWAQVVAGVKYWIHTELKVADTGAVERHDFILWDRFGTMKVLAHEKVD